MLGESLNESLSSVELDVVFFWVSCRILEAFTSMCKVNGAVHPRPWCRSTTGGKNWAGCCCCYLTARKVPEVGQECSQRNDDSYCVMVCSCGHARHFLRCLTGLSMGVTAWLIARYHLSPYVFDGHYTERLASSFSLVLNLSTLNVGYGRLCASTKLSENTAIIYLSYNIVHISFLLEVFPIEQWNFCAA